MQTGDVGICQAGRKDLMKQYLSFIMGNGVSSVFGAWPIVIKSQDIWSCSVQILNVVFYLSYSLWKYNTKSLFRVMSTCS